jgi:Cytochrome bd-type quinol oxidase, subunit 2
MFETFSIYTLQHYWWIIDSLLGGILVFLLFVQGGQTLIYELGKTDMEQTIIVNSLGRKWEFTFTTLVTFGGAMFASFPLFYSTSFGGAYWVWMAILFCFVVQAVAYEFRSKPSNIFGKKTFEAFLLINGFLGTVLLGAAVATMFTGSQFSVDFTNISTVGGGAISKWQSAAHGLEATLDFRNLLLGLAVFFLSRTLAILYFINNVGDGNIVSRAKTKLLINSVPFVLFFVAFVAAIFLSKGFAYGADKAVYMQAYKYFTNFIQMPLVALLFLLGVVAVLAGIALTLIKPDFTKGIWFSGAGTIVTVFSLLLDLGFNNTAFYPSSFDLQSSISIENGSSSHYTLTAMSYVSLLVPFVAAYMWYAWKSINNKKIDAAEMNEESHAY